MAIEDIRAITKKHPFFIAILFALSFYFLYLLWYDGIFAITRSQKLRAVARRSIYYRDNLPNIPFPLYPYRKWRRDETLIPTAKEHGDELIPYLGELFISKEGRNKTDLTLHLAVQFILMEAISSKMALDVLVNNIDNKIDLSELSNFIGPTALACVVPINSLLKLPKKDFNQFEKEQIKKWHAENAMRIVDTDYGIGITMPDGNIRPLGLHGVHALSSTMEKYYFCTEKELAYYHNLTLIRRELGSIINSKRLPPQELRLDNKALQEAASAEFRRLFDERVTSDSTFWPYYPIFGSFSNIFGTFYFTLGYRDADHRLHGLWRDIEESRDENSRLVQRLVGERWFFHGEEVTEDEYYERGGYDMDISLCTACPGIPASDSAPEQASGQ